MSHDRSVRDEVVPGEDVRAIQAQTNEARAIEADIIVSGAGATGLVAALSLGRAGYTVVCAGVPDTRATGRTVALFEGSLRFLRSIGISVEPVAQRIRAIDIIDDTGARIAAPPLTLDASEIGLDALGANIETDKLIALLRDEAAAMPNVHLTGTLLIDVVIDEDAVRASDATGSTYTASLIAAADGRRSPTRLAAKIGARTWSYPQVAITALISHRKPHGGRSVEFHTRGGPCTLVPLRGTTDRPHRSSLVWLMNPTEAERRRTLSDAELAVELQHQTRSVVGRITFEAARGVFPMAGLKVNRLAGRRTVLLGEAAHAFPPLAAQGLNLSLRDIMQLVATLADARGRDLDPGSAAALQPYERARRRDVALRTSGVDVLNRSIITDLGPIDAARGIGTMALRMIGPLRRAIMREGILPPMPLVGDGNDFGATRAVPSFAASSIRQLRRGSKLSFSTAVLPRPVAPSGTST